MTTRAPGKARRSTAVRSEPHPSIDLGNVHSHHVSGWTVLAHQIIVRAIAGEPTANACGRFPDDLGIVTGIGPVACFGDIRECTRLEVPLFRASVDDGVPPQ